MVLMCPIRHSWDVTKCYRNTRTLDKVKITWLTLGNMADQVSSLTLPLRRRDQLRRVLAGQPIGQASLDVGYKTKNVGTHALSDTRKRLLAAMDYFHLTPETFTRDYLLPLLNATSTITASYEGKITDTLEVSDNGTRLSAAKECGKLMGLYPREQLDGPSHLAISITNTVDVHEAEE
jgi:hypothetical protein